MIVDIRVSVSLVVMVSGIMQTVQSFNNFEVLYKENYEKKYSRPMFNANLHRTPEESQLVTASNTALIHI